MAQCSLSHATIRMFMRSLRGRNMAVPREPRRTYKMHKHEVTAIIDPTETSVARKLLKAQPPLGTIDL